MNLNETFNWFSVNKCKRVHFYKESIGYNSKKKKNEQTINIVM